MSIIELSKFRKSQTYEEQHRGEQRYFCQQCSNEVFKIWANNAVTCVSCGSLMSNLTVHFSPPAA